MGHLLLGDNSHSVNGIMHIPWRPKELEIIREGRMAFMPEEAAAMRVNVRGRIHAAQATQAVLLPGPRMVANWPHTSVDTSYSVPIGPSSNREPASAPRLTVVIYDHVHVGPEALALAGRLGGTQQVLKPDESIPDVADPFHDLWLLFSQPPTRRPISSMALAAKP